MALPSHRISLFTESVIRGMSRVAQAHGAMNLAQGFPDFDPPEELLAGLRTSVTSGHHQYANTWGAPEFRIALAEKIHLDSGLHVDPDRHLTVTCGSTEAMVASLMATLNPGNKVAVFSPFYENYRADGILSGAETLHVPLHLPDWSFDSADLEKAFRAGARVLVLCNPSNPCGKVFTLQELSEIARLAIAYDAVVVTDEVYEHIIYDGRKHVHLATLPGMWERTLTCSSLSKTYSITGWRLGYVLAHEKWTDAVRKVHDFLTVGAAHPLQMAAIEGLKLPRSYYANLATDYQRKRGILCDALAAAGFTVRRPEGAYFVLVDVSQLGFDNDTQAAEWMAKEIGVTGVPGSSFFETTVPPLLRFHFSRRDETLHEAAIRFARLREKI
jgi:aspartate/methionine/tyrosine aminotransferase